MVVDSSAIVAVVQRESTANRLTDTLIEADKVHISAGTYVESSVVLGRRHGEIRCRELDRVLDRFGVNVQSVGLDQARATGLAFLRFGKGRHPAGLNFGDCFSYALAKERDEPLLFVGGRLHAHGRPSRRVARPNSRKGLTPALRCDAGSAARAVTGPGRGDGCSGGQTGAL